MKRLIFSLVMFALVLPSAPSDCWRPRNCQSTSGRAAPLSSLFDSLALAASPLSGHRTHLPFSPLLRDFVQPFIQREVIDGVFRLPGSPRAQTCPWPHPVWKLVQEYLALDFAEHRLSPEAYERVLKGDGIARMRNGQVEIEEDAIPALTNGLNQFRASFGLPALTDLEVETHLKNHEKLHAEWSGLGTLFEGLWAALSNPLLYSNSEIPNREALQIAFADAYGERFRGEANNRAWMEEMVVLLSENQTLTGLPAARLATDSSPENWLDIPLPVVNLIRRMNAANPMALQTDLQEFPNLVNPPLEKSRLLIIPQHLHAEARSVLPRFRQFRDAANALYYSHFAHIGHHADFITHPERYSPLFGRMIAEQIIRIWRHMKNQGTLDSQSPFFLLEAGGGNGVLARDIMSYIRTRSEADPEWKAFHRHVRYVLEEHFERQRIRQRQTVSDANLSDEIHCVPDALNELPESFQGIVLNNELFDDLSAEQIAVYPDGRVEIGFVIPSIKKQALAHLPASLKTLIQREDSRLRQTMAWDIASTLYLTATSFKQIVEWLSLESSRNMDPVAEAIRFSQAFLPAEQDEKASLLHPGDLEDISRAMSQTTFAGAGSSPQAPTRTAAGIPDYSEKGLIYYWPVGAHDFINRLSDRMRAGAFITVDYGHDAETLAQYEREKRSAIGVYGLGVRFKDPFLFFGSLGLTVNVNFTSIFRRAVESGLDDVLYAFEHVLLSDTSLHPTDFDGLGIDGHPRGWQDAFKLFTGADDPFYAFKVMILSKGIEGAATLFAANSKLPWKKPIPSSLKIRRRSAQIQRKLSASV